MGVGGCASVVKYLLVIFNALFFVSVFFSCLRYVNYIVSNDINGSCYQIVICDRRVLLQHIFVN